MKLLILAAALSVAVGSPLRGSHVDAASPWNNHERALKEKLEVPSTLHFEVECREVTAGSAVFVVGSVPELGDWEPTKALRLHTTPERFPVWTETITLSLKSFGEVHYKVMIQREDASGGVFWEPIAGDRVLEVHRGTALMIQTGWGRDKQDIEAWAANGEAIIPSASKALDDEDREWEREQANRRQGDSDRKRRQDERTKQRKHAYSGQPEEEPKDFDKEEQMEERRRRRDDRKRSFESKRKAQYSGVPDDEQTDTGKPLDRDEKWTRKQRRFEKQRQVTYSGASDDEAQAFEGDSFGVSAEDRESRRQGRQRKFEKQRQAQYSGAPDQPDETRAEAKKRRKKDEDDDQMVMGMKPTHTDFKVQSSLHFDLVCKEASPGNTVFVVGSTPELGEWDVNRAIPLHTTPKRFPRWAATLSEVPAGNIKYGFLIRREDGHGDVVWEASVPGWTNGDRTVDVRAGSAITITTAWGDKKQEVETWGKSGFDDAIVPESPFEGIKAGAAPWQEDVSDMRADDAFRAYDGMPVPGEPETFREDPSIVDSFVV